uniref:Uncharacterized protein n=1 Tax=Arundo donax TaxID=35708 RepID=A0A0A9B0K0_ARUDO
MSVAAASVAGRCKRWR